MTTWQRLYRRYAADLARIARLLSLTRTPEQLDWLANEPAFREVSELIARRMALTGIAENARTWREAARKAGRSGMFYRALQNELKNTPVGAAVKKTVRKNADLISTLPLHLARQATAFIARRRQEGARDVEVRKELQAWFPRVAASRLKLIARTELAKAETALSRARSEQLAIPAYVWESSHDERVRTSHEFMDGVIVFWNDPPNPDRLIGKPTTLTNGHCGEFPNCRCVSLPLISLDEVRWPARVHRHGRIVQMRRAEFRRIAGYPIAA